jgi:hypothetical protein
VNKIETWIGLGLMGIGLSGIMVLMKNNDMVTSKKTPIEIRSLDKIELNEIPTCKINEVPNTSHFIFIPLGKPMASGANIEVINVGLCKTKNSTIKVMVM